MLHPTRFPWMRRKSSRSYYYYSTHEKNTRCVTCLSSEPEMKNSDVKTTVRTQSLWKAVSYITCPVSAATTLTFRSSEPVTILYMHGTHEVGYTEVSLRHTVGRLGTMKRFVSNLNEVRMAQKEAIHSRLHISSTAYRHILCSFSA
jgi:hypothetical protein